MTRENLTDFDKWRENIRKRLPELSERVFKLREVLYIGCGFQWHIERKLGQVIYHITDYDRDDCYHGLAVDESQANMKRLVSSLVSDVEAAEKSARNTQQSES